MKYISTRGERSGLSASQVIIKGIAADGGLYLPESVPVLSKEEQDSLIGKSYKETACFVLGKFLTDFSEAEIADCVEKAYTETAFDGGEAPIVQLGGGVNVLELWHGPTCAFKDMALQLMPRLFTASLRKNNIEKKAVILAATSGDTGKAALEGFRDVDGVSIAVFFPNEGVSAVQKRQMTSQAGKNVAVAAIKGNFDDAQNAVKRIFADAEFNKTLDAKNAFLTSANSINWGRLVPQIVYYIYTCVQLKARGEIGENDTIDICVPTGNFGNILACYYAKKMGAPIGKLICASNSNNVLTDFINTGTYSRKREFIKTSSPSMDILISSNLERLLFELSRRDGEYISELMRQLSSEGSYTISGDIKRLMDELFEAGYCDDAGTRDEIKLAWEEQGYLLDTHTAVASEVLRRYREQIGENNGAVVVSTASPFKFASSVLEALGKPSPDDELKAVEALKAATGLSAPKGLRDIDKLPVLHNDVLEKEQAESWLLEKLF